MPIATPEVYAEMLGRAKEHSFAFPAINCVGSESVNAAIKGFADAGSDGIIQVSTGGASYLSGAKVADMVVGPWHCFGSISGRNADYDFGEDGVLRITQSDGKVASGRYMVAGRRIAYQGSDGAFALEIESISASRMVQLVGGGERLACDRRS